MPSTNGHGSKPERVALYLRVSSEEQRKAGTIETQLEVLRDYAKREGLEVVGEYPDDGVSGLTKFHKRPAGRRLLADAGGVKAEAVLVYRLDRLGRSNLRILDAIDRLREAGATVRSIKEGIDTGTREGALQVHMLGFAAEIERGAIEERTRDGLHRALRDGRQPGVVPFGYSVERNGDGQDSFVIVPEEAEIVRGIISSIASGATLYSEAKRLNEAGIASPGRRYSGDTSRRSRGRWTPETIRSLVRQSAYAGIHRAHTTSGVIERPVPAIVDPKVHARALEQLRANRHRSGELRKNGRKYLLTGIIRCGECGRPCVGRAVSSKGRKYAYYTCTSNRAPRHPATRHPAPNVNAEWIESQVWSDVKRFLQNPGEVLERVREQRADKGERAELEARRNALQKRVANIEAEITNLFASIAAGVSARRVAPQISEREQSIEHIGEMIAEIEAEIAEADAEQARAESTAAYLNTLAKRLAEVEADTTEAFARRRELVQLLVASLTAELGEAYGRPRVRIRYRFGPPPEVVPSAKNFGRWFLPNRRAKLRLRALTKVAER
jgi:site-specific DNA recombinase